VNFDKYVGLQYGFKGRGPTYDCYGLVILVYREMAALELPSFAESYTSDDDRRELNALISNQLTPWIEIPWGQERPLDCVLMREGRCIRHIGVVVKPGYVLHVSKANESQIERYRESALRRSVVGFYRHKEIEARRGEGGSGAGQADAACRA
jgi:probable lipoprotein NlpC